MPSSNRAKRGEYVSRVPQSALDKISLQMQEQRETIERLKSTQDKFIKLARLAAEMNVFGSTDNAKIRDTARTLLVEVGATKF